MEKLQNKKIDVLPVGIRKGTCANLAIINNLEFVDHVHTITIYLNPLVQKDYYAYILSLQAKRVIFNPGAENSELAQLLHRKNINTKVLNACSLVMLNIGNYNL